MVRRCYFVLFRFRFGTDCPPNFERCLCFRSWFLMLRNAHIAIALTQIGTRTTHLTQHEKGKKHTKCELLNETGYELGHDDDCVRYTNARVPYTRNGRTSSSNKWPNFITATAIAVNCRCFSSSFSVLVGLCSQWVALHTPLKLNDRNKTKMNKMFFFLKRNA